MAFTAIMFLWDKKPLKVYGNRMSESMLAILCHVVKGESVIKACTRLPLLPWLVPPSGVAGIADDLIPPCCPVCCIVLFNPTSVISLLHAYVHLRCGRPLLLFPVRVHVNI